MLTHQEIVALAGEAYRDRRRTSTQRRIFALMRRIDELHLEYPFAGSSMLQGLLLAEGCLTGRLHVATLMKRMEVGALPPAEHLKAGAGA